MTTSPEQRLRCPCCGQTFALADALPAGEAQHAPEAAEAQIVTDTSRIAVTLVFDGGSIGNPGRGYGSYQLTIRGKAEAPRRVQFGDGYTNNEAEYDTLVEALQALLRRAKDPRLVDLEILGDSKLVISQITGAWKTKEPRMRQRKERVLDLLKQFGGWRATWHERGNSVKALGH